ncbi:hypothetical protein LCGC14_2537970 [marine sediment metagenome]|uniref:Uncharacterized protein n=1 Tax=marine sediment metagenome TaxID=412755 RepID=A0A0F9DJM6_9ZZZZ
MRPTTLSRSCRSQASCSGVCPEGAQVRRRNGCSMKPLSSKKTMGVSLRFAPFLFVATPACATAECPPRCALALVARASGVSNPSCGESSRREPDDISHQTSWQSLRPPADRSKGRYGNQPCTVRPKESLSVAASVSRSGGVWGRDVVWPSRPPILHSSRPDTIALPRIRKQRRFGPPRRFSCLPAVVFLPADDEFPTRLRFLSFSYTTVRMSTIKGSLATQGSIEQLKFSVSPASSIYSQALTPDT